MLATDTQKNTVYAFAQRLGPVPPEAFGMELAAFFVASQPQITRARVAVEDYGWSPDRARPGTRSPGPAS